MLKHAALCLLAWSALLAGCDNPEGLVSGAETSPPPAPPVVSSASAPAQDPAPVPATAIAGCWVKVTPGVVITETISADGTCSEDVTTDPAISSGRHAFDTCTWSAVDSSSLVFTYAVAGPQLCTYIIVGDALTMLCPSFEGPQAYQRKPC